MDRLCHPGHFSPRPEFCLVLQVPRLCPEPVAAARAPEPVPLDEYLADLTSFLPAGVPTGGYWFLSLVTDAYTLTSHIFSLYLHSSSDHFPYYITLVSNLIMPTSNLYPLDIISFVSKGRAPVKRNNRFLAG